MTEPEVTCKRCGRVIPRNELQYDSFTGWICKDCREGRPLSTSEGKVKGAFTANGASIPDSNVKAKMSEYENAVQRLTSLFSRGEISEASYKIALRSLEKEIPELKEGKGEFPVAPTVSKPSDARMLQQVWDKGKVVSNNDPSVWRKDACNAWIKKTEYGNRNSQYSWEIDHIDPNGGNELSNLRPLQWENHLAKSEKGELTCDVTCVIQGIKNVNRKSPVSKPSSAWYLVPFFLGIIGGLLGYIAVKAEDKELANGLLALGIVMTVIGMFLFLLI